MLIWEMKRYFLFFLLLLKYNDFILIMESVYIENVILVIEKGILFLMICKRYLKEVKVF